MFRIGGDRNKIEYIFELTDFVLTELDPELGTAQPLLVIDIIFYRLFPCGYFFITIYRF